jgi:AcrR family transcriptional regulator
VYFHFRSKYALALAVIEDQATKYMAAAQDLLTRKLSGLETLVDVAYLIAVADISEDIARAGLNLLESVGRNEGLQTKLLGDWVQLLGLIVERAAAEGETIEQPDARDVGRLLVSLYLGMRQTSDLDQPEQFLLNLEKSFSLVLPGIVREDPIGDFRQLIRRRTALAIESISIPADSD